MSWIVAIGPSAFGTVDQHPRELLLHAGIEIKENPFGRRLTEEEITAHLEGVDGLLAGLEPLNEKVLSGAAPRLKALARVGIGMNNVDQDAAQRLGIRVSNTPEPPAHAVAEMTLTAMLTLLRKLLPANSDLHSGIWQKHFGTGLSNTPVLLIGYGHIGRKVGALLRAFNAHVLVYDPFIDRHTLQDGEQPVSLEEGLQRAAVISLHACGDTCLLDKKAFSQMQQGAILLNAARGELVDESAMINALDKEILAGAWIDTFWNEPYDGPIMQYEQVLLTPHMSTYTVQCRREMETQAVQHILRDLGVGQ